MRWRHPLLALGGPESARSQRGARGRSSVARRSGESIRARPRAARLLFEACEQRIRLRQWPTSAASRSGRSISTHGDPDSARAASASPPCSHAPPEVEADLQEPHELVSADPRGLDDLAQRALGEVASMHWNHYPVGVIRVPEDVVTALDSIQFPAAALQRPNCLSWRDRRESRSHAATVTRSISTGPGTLSP